MTTYHDVRSRAMESHSRRQHMYARGGEVHDDEAEDKELIKKMVKPSDLKKRADGGAVAGRARGGKTDRPKHGGKVVVNVIAPGGGGSPSPPMPVRPPMAAPPPGAMPPGGPPPGAMPPRPPMAGMGPMPGGPPPGPPGGSMMPMRARGGRARRADGGGTGEKQAPWPDPPDQPDRFKTPPPRNDGRARGGRMTGGAASGVGREEKAEGGFKGRMIERD